jgi:hypothetical protein
MPSNAGLRLRIAGRQCAPERPAKPKLVQPPVVVLDPVDQSHRDEVPIGRAERGVIKDRAFHPLDTQVLGHAFDHLAHRAAQVAAGFGDEGDPCRDCVAHDPTLGGKPWTGLLAAPSRHDGPSRGRGMTSGLTGAAARQCTHRAQAGLRRRPTGAATAGSRASAGSSRGPGR